MNIQENTLVFRLGDNDNIIKINKRSQIKHFIAVLDGLDIDVVKKIKDKLLIFAQSIDKKNGSFVVVYNITFDDKLVIVPTIQEAFDYIEMEDIERKLEL